MLSSCLNGPAAHEAPRSSDHLTPTCPTTEVESIVTITRAKTLYDRSLIERRIASAVMDDFLGGPTRRAAASLTGAESSVPHLLATLARVYRVRTWDTAEFRRVYAQGALAAWKPGTLVMTSARELRVCSSICPIGREAETDANRCAECRAVHTAAARVALGPAFRAAWFEEIIAHGDAVCVFVVQHAPNLAAETDAKSEVTRRRAEADDRRAALEATRRAVKSRIELLRAKLAIKKLETQGLLRESEALASRASKGRESAR